MRKSLVFILFMAIAIGVRAQVQVETKIDSMEILIGEQTNLTLSVSMKKGRSLQMPEFAPSQFITPGVEVLSTNQADTAELDDDMVQVNKVYTLTSFDENLYYLPEMAVKVDGKEYKSKSLALKVITMPVDTLHPENFFPPKDVQDNPFQWSEWSGIFWMSVLMVLLICAAFYLRLRLKDNKPIIAHVRIVKKILPHQKAMTEIEKIKAERMASSEDQKAYYTRLTDTLRVYIEERFGFSAMEMTSSEIIERLQQAEDRKMIDELRELFTTADLVKFAKYSTLINENDANLVNAIEFINTTKLENVPTTERVEPKLSETEMRSMRSRTALKWTIYILAILAAALFVSVLYQVYRIL
ncbi:MAG: hypothetical protein IJ582_04145 [Prevotella sp.]|nr:hypothetical protein [Prevotella sp.]